MHDRTYNTAEEIQAAADAVIFTSEEKMAIERMNTRPKFPFMHTAPLTAAAQVEFSEKEKEVIEARNKTPRFPFTNSEPSTTATAVVKSEKQKKDKSHRNLEKARKHVQCKDEEKKTSTKSRSK